MLGETFTLTKQQRPIRTLQKIPLGKRKIPMGFSSVPTELRTPLRLYPFIKTEKQRYEIHRSLKNRTVSGE